MPIQKLKQISIGATDQISVRTIETSEVLSSLFYHSLSRASPDISISVMLAFLTVE
jgi:hypothetical protein